MVAYIAENQGKIALKAKLHLEMASEDNLAEVVDHTLDQRLDYIYDDEPLCFEKDPVNSTEKIKAQDSLE